MPSRRKKNGNTGSSKPYNQLNTICLNNQANQNVKVTDKAGLVLSVLFQDAVYITQDFSYLLTPNLPAYT